MKIYKTLLSLLIIVSLVSCNDESTDVSIESIDDVKTSEVETESIPTRRSTLLNSSNSIIKTHAAYKKDVSNLKKDVKNLKQKNQSKRVKEKIKTLNEKIYRIRSAYIAIEQNDIKASSLPSHKRIDYTNLSFELVQIKKQRDAYSHRNDKRANDVRSGLDEKKRVIKQKIQILLNE